MSDDTREKLEEAWNNAVAELREYLKKEWTFGKPLDDAATVWAADEIISLRSQLATAEAEAEKLRTWQDDLPSRLASAEKEISKLIDDLSVSETQLEAFQAMMKKTIIVIIGSDRHEIPVEQLLASALRSAE